jgi:spermidine synthase
MHIEIDIPDGKSGVWSIETFTVEKNELSQVFSMFKTGRGVPEGTYKRLCRYGHVIMSNTPDEIRDFIRFVHKANGSILVNGLGLGVLLKALLEKETITDITVIEKEQDVINLVAPYIKDDRVTIICANAFDYIPPKDKKYNYVWHDIWDNICADNLKEMKTLHRKYGRKTEYQESWCRSQCEYYERQDKKDSRYNKYY